jgi:hypothetical protein
MNTSQAAAESTLFRRPSGHIEAMTPDVSASFQLWSFLFAHKGCSAAPFPAAD